MRVLIVGREASDFLCDLYRDVSNSAGISFDLLELREIPQRNQENVRVAFGKSHSCDFLKLRSAGLGLLKASPSTFARTLIRERSMKRAMVDSVVARHVSALFSQYDVVHFQFLTAECIRLVRFVPPHVRRVATFWGSDLFQCNPDFDHSTQFNVLQTMDQITVHSPEMKQILLSKFGRQFGARVTTELVVSGDTVFNRIEAASRTNAAKSFRDEHRIAPSEVVVLVGGSASQSGNHKAVIEGLSRLNDDTKRLARFVFPMTYGAPTPDYVEEVRSAAASMELRTVFLETFLPDDSVCGMRLAADLTIKLPDFDAFSLALCEDIYAGAIAVTGTWLPYGVLRTSGIHHLEIADYSELSPLLDEACANLESHRNRARTNPDRIRTLLGAHERVSVWSNFYHSLAG